MKVKVTGNILLNGSFVKKGEVVEVTAFLAQELVHRQDAVLHVEAPAPAPALAPAPAPAPAPAKKAAEKAS